MQKVWHFALHDVFIYKNPDTSQKARQFTLSFYIQKYGHFALRNFSLNFSNWWRGRGTFFDTKNNALCVTFLYAKKCTLRYVFIYKSLTLCDRFLYAKNNALCVKFFYLKFYLIVLISNYKCTYDQRNHIKK